MSLRHRNCLLCPTLLFFVDLFSILSLIFSQAFFASFFSFMLFKLTYSTTMSPLLLFVFQMSLPAQFQLFFLGFLLFCSNHQVTHPCLQSPGHLLSKCFLTACLIHFPPSYLWLYFLCFFLFHYKNHFAHHHTVLLATHSFTITLQSHIFFRFLFIYIT